MKIRTNRTGTMTKKQQTRLAGKLAAAFVLGSGTWMAAGMLTMPAAEASASDNTVTITAVNKDDAGNTITVNSEGYYIAGHAAESGTESTASNNKLTFSNDGTITTSTFPFRIVAGRVLQNGAASAVNNTITLNTNAAIAANIFYGGLAFVNGGYTDKATATGNTLSLEKGTLSGSGVVLTAGSATGYTAEATGNTLSISGGTATGLYALTGGEAISASGGSVSAANNSIKVTGGTLAVAGDICGGDAESSQTSSAAITVDASGNAVTLNDADVSYAGTIYGGKAKGNTLAAVTASTNTVTIQAGTFKGSSIYGGYGDSGTTDKSDGNTVTITGGTFASGTAITGGYVSSFTAGAASASRHNVVSIMGGTVAGSMNRVYGGKADAGNSNVTDNTVELDSANVSYNTVYGGYAQFSKNAEATVSNNAVTMKAGTVSASINGGEGYLTGSDKATISSNTVTLEGGETSNIAGSYAQLNGTGNTAALTGNTVNLNGGHAAWVWGAQAADTTTGSTSTITVTGNTVNLNQGSIGFVYGGEIDVNSGVFSGTATIAGNTVNLNGGSCGAVYGGKSTSTGVIIRDNIINWTGSIVSGTIYGGIGAVCTGNTLNVKGIGLTAGNLSNFSTINYMLPASTADGTTVITLTGTEGTDLTGTTVNVDTTGASSLKGGDTVTLLKTNGTLTTSDTTLGGTLKKDDGMQYTLKLAADKNNLKLQLVGGALQAQTKSLVETAAGIVSQVNSGADFLAGTWSMNAADAAGATPGSYTPVFAASGSNLRANSGSYVDIHGQSMALGFAAELKDHTGTLLLSPMVEYGKGNYTSHLDDGTRGDGSSHYFGGGIYARQMQPDGLYYEGSLRAGRTTADYRSYDLDGATGTSDGHVSYDTDASYLGVHAGVGQLQKLAGGDTLDYYGKYFYSHTGNDDVKLSTGYVYHFDAVESQRVRLGSRFTHKVNAQSSLYAGLAYQYEFDGSAQAHYNGFSTASPSLKGSSGMLELGCHLRPSAESRWLIDLGLNGWSGKQQGVTAQAGVQLAF
jgi:hypothetical protein